MLIRQLLFAILLLATPASLLAASECCRADDLCCPEERPACPVEETGTCMSVVDSRTVATISTTGHESMGPLPAQRVERGPIFERETHLDAPPRSNDPPQSQRRLPLRN